MSGPALNAQDAFVNFTCNDIQKSIKFYTEGLGLRLWLNTTQDITALAGRATAAGLKLDEGPKALPWGPMAFAVTDPDGFKLTVSNQTAS